METAKALVAILTLWFVSYVSGKSVIPFNNNFFCFHARYINYLKRGKPILVPLIGQSFQMIRFKIGVFN